MQPPRGDGPIVTSFIFNVRNLPAALYKALGGFATNGVNMTKLESYMVGGHFTATQFLAEVDGHPDDPPLHRALEELAFFTTDVKVLGVYPADAFRTRKGLDRIHISVPGMMRERPSGRHHLGHAICLQVPRLRHRRPDPASRRPRWPGRSSG